MSQLHTSLPTQKSFSNARVAEAKGERKGDAPQASSPAGSTLDAFTSAQNAAFAVAAAGADILSRTFSTSRREALDLAAAECAAGRGTTPGCSRPEMPASGGTEMTEEEEEEEEVELEEEKRQKKERCRPADEKAGAQVENEGGGEKSALSASLAAAPIIQRPADAPRLLSADPSPTLAPMPNSDFLPSASSFEGPSKREPRQLQRQAYSDLQHEEVMWQAHELLLARKREADQAAQLMAAQASTLMVFRTGRVVEKKPAAFTVM